MASIKWSAFPTLATLEKVYPTAVDKLPENYKGTSEDKFLAFSVGHALETKTFAELAHFKPTIPAYMDTPNSRKFAQEFVRFADVADIDAYYDFIALFNRQRLTDHEIHYVVSLATMYSGARLNHALSVVSAIHKYQTDDLERRENEIVFASVEELENLFALSRVLRREGLLMETRFLWVASSHWQAEEVLKLIEEGLPIRKAMELYTMGFTSVDEIITFSDMLPDSWVSRIFEGAPTSGENL